MFIWTSGVNQRWAVYLTGWTTQGTLSDICQPWSVPVKIKVTRKYIRLLLYRISLCMYTLHMIKVHVCDDFGKYKVFQIFVPMKYMTKHISCKIYFAFFNKHVCIYAHIEIHHVTFDHFVVKFLISKIIRIYFKRSIVLYIYCNIWSKKWFYFLLLINITSFKRPIFAIIKFPS